MVSGLTLRKTSDQQGQMRRTGSKQPIAGVQGWPQSLTFKHADLLAPSEDFQGGLALCTDGNSECNQHGEEELDHELTL
jgi:hypothetical protein